MSRFSGTAATLLLVLLGGCAVKLSIAPPAPTPPAPRCDFVRYRLQAETPPTGLLAAAAVSQRTVASVLNERLASAPVAPVLPKMLFMSGGSQHGAFGAGLLDEWRRLGPGGRLPEFRVVTGVSTGSILATMAFTGDTAKLVGLDGYGITSERQLLTPVLDNASPLAEILSLSKVLGHGAVADLTPLRTRLLGVIDDSVLRRVAGGHRAGRLLLIGAVDVDSGQAVAFDLTEMAARYVGESDPARKAVLHNCYVDAIVASSSAPIAAQPVFIDNYMYIDGGARFGVFSDEVGGVIRSAATAPPRADAYLIVNGTLSIDPDCGAEAKFCPAGGGPAPVPPGGVPPPHREWSLVGLGLRSVDILEHQVYRLSVERIEAQSKISGSTLHFARIEPASDDHRFTMPPELGLGTGTRTCGEWTAEDKRIDRPLQFYPRYMHCLIDYGRARLRGLGWADVAGETRRP
jgi:hypothetical protein